MENTTTSHKTIHIDNELHKKLKLEALKHNLSLRELVEAKLGIAYAPKQK